MYRKNKRMDLAVLYEILNAGWEPSIRRYHVSCSAVIATKFLIKERLGIKIDTDSLETMMYEEGLLPASAYGIPKWYQSKWMSGYKPRHKNEQKL